MEAPTVPVYDPTHPHFVEDGYRPTRWEAVDVTEAPDGTRITEVVESVAWETEPAGFMEWYRRVSVGRVDLGPAGPGYYGPGRYVCAAYECGCHGAGFVLTAPDRRPA